MTGCSLVAIRDSSYFFAAVLSSSKSRFTDSTFTRGSPRNPHCRPCVFLAMIARTCCSVIPRAFAMRGAWNSAAAGVMSGSSPDAEVVTKSTGTGCPGFSDDAAYRAMDFLLEALGEIAAQIFDSVAHLLNLDVDIVFVDSPANRSVGSAGAVAG